MTNAQDSIQKTISSTSIKQERESSKWNGTEQGIDMEVEARFAEIDTGPRNDNKGDRRQIHQSYCY